MDKLAGAGLISQSELSPRERILLASCSSRRARSCASRVTIAVGLSWCATAVIAAAGGYGRAGRARQSGHSSPMAALAEASVTCEPRSGHSRQMLGTCCASAALGAPRAGRAAPNPVPSLNRRVRARVLEVHGEDRSSEARAAGVRLLAIIAMIDKGAISSSAANDISNELRALGGDPAAGAKGLRQVSDEGPLEKSVVEVL
jgi:hypothetical protein